MITNIFYLILMFLSFAGYGLWIQKKFHLHSSLIPIITFSSVILILFLAGVLNILPHVTFLVFFLGLFSLLIYILKYRTSSFIYLFSPGLVFFIAASVALTFILKDRLFVHYDDFTHWGLVVKEMLRIDGLPDDSTTVTFKNYPPGTALFIYYILRIVGFAESLAMMAQSYLIFASLAPLFIYAEWKKPLTIIAPLFIAAALFIMGGQNFYTLLVDPLLGYLSIAVALISYYFRKETKKLILINTLIMSFLILIKDSGKLFFGVLLLWLLYLLFQEFRKLKGEQIKKIFSYILLPAVTPLFVNFLWGRYTSKAYDTAYEDNKFALTTDSIFQIERSPGFVNELFYDVLKAAFDLNNSFFQAILWLLLAIIGSLLFIVIKERFFPKKYVAITGTFILFYILYITALFAMYVFLMPEGEAEQLASFDRYMSSISIFLVGSMSLFLLILFKENLVHYGSLVSKISFTSITLITLVILHPQISNLFTTYQPEETQFRTELHERYESLTNNSTITPESRFTLIYTNDYPGKGYIDYLLTYERLSTNSTVLSNCSPQENDEGLIKELNYSDFMTVLESNPSMTECLEQYSDQEIKQRNYELKEDHTVEKIEP